MSDRKLTTIEVRHDEQVPSLVIMKFTRPGKLNSYIQEQYFEVSSELQRLDADDSVSVVLMTGSGRFFSSGTDMGVQTQQPPSGVDLEDFMRERTEKSAGALIRTMIDFKKPLIAACNGPAVGVACTTLALCDVVYASNTSWFHTPFMQFAFCPEGCSSLLFPRIMGQSLANEVLLLGRKLSAAEALQCGFVSNVFSDPFFAEEVLKRARTMASFPPKGLQVTKRLVRGEAERAALHEACDRELKALVKQFVSDECVTAVMKFAMEQMNRKKKAKARL